MLGYPLSSNEAAGPFGQTRFWLYITSVVTLLLVIALAKYLVYCPFGKVLIAIRDDETRLRFAGYKTWAYKAAAFMISAMFAGIGGMLYVPQKGIITPQQMTAFASILVVIWVALGGRGTIWGAVFGAFVVNLLYDAMTTRAPEYWMYLLGGLFILVPLALPDGLMNLPRVVGKWVQGRLPTPAHPHPEAAEPRKAGTRPPTQTTAAMAGGEA